MMDAMANGVVVDRLGVGPAPTVLTRRGVMRSGATAGTAGIAGALAACGMPGTSQPQPGAATGVVNVLYYTSTEPATARMQRQEAAIRQSLPSLNTTMIPTPDIVGKF